MGIGRHIPGLFLGEQTIETQFQHDGFVLLDAEEILKALRIDDENQKVYVLGEESPFSSVTGHEFTPHEHFEPYRS
ncbi:hypothetical protein [Bacillus sp. FDAARGOS_1420]|uniref:hypothetical protein n=1 Tax=unclassified Bacillus (in: firmicutes) TaxID=185979 RepID=UPI001C5BA792|nr:hypothetical protein [Bacillus sp. FDAARGOS_1420]MBW3496795.1 hypothetical protein [Bacillus sp. FDAARGOS_1420]